MRNYKSYTLLDAAAPRAITSSTNATPIAVTAASHGLVTGDKITIFGHATNTAANGTWVVTRTGANTFTLNNSVGNGIGAGTGTFAKGGVVPLLDDFQHAIISINTDGGGDAAMTVKLVGSIQDTMPDFAEAQSASNSYDYIEMIDLQDGSSLDGDTGFVVATADDHRLFEANINGLKWLSVVPTAGTAGEVTVKVRLFTE